MSLGSALEDVQPLHPSNVRFIPSPDARVTLMNLPKEQSHLNGLVATVLVQASAKSSSGAIKVPLPPAACACCSQNQAAPDRPLSSS
jgi:hypothetical protein